jgi:glutamate racemase
MSVGPDPVPAFAPQNEPDLRGAIGVFDSGVGGLSVLRSIRQALPHESLVYVADTGHAPYGDKPAAHIVDRTLRVGRWLAAGGVRAITVACNTATMVAVRELRQCTHLPVVAIEPAIKPAVGLSSRGVVGVLATQQTIQSEGVARLIERYAQGARVVLQACPGWVEQVERGDLDSPATLALLRQHTHALIEAGADVWVLGCTHFPFLWAGLRQIAGPDVTFIDPADAVARELRRRLSEAGGGRSDAPTGRGTEFFYTTGDPTLTREVMSMLWGRRIQVQRLPDLNTL